MPAGIRFDYDDKWILERWEVTHNWLTLCNEYNKAHGTDIGYNAFKSHCNRMGLNYRYTEEQNEFLKQTYPHKGRVVTAELFNKTFGTHKTPIAIQKHCHKNLGLLVTQERNAQKAIENTGRFHEVGTVKKMGNHGLCIKTSAGWERIADNVIGKAPKGHRIVHLDGDISNNTKENLMHMSFAHCALMTRYGFWSNTPLITQTGAVWCDLYEKQGGLNEQRSNKR